MTEKRGFDFVAYILGIVSIIMAFFSPLAGLAFGVVGLVQSKKQKTPLSDKAKKLNLIGVILSGVLFVISLVAATLLAKLGLTSLLGQ